MMFIRYIIIFFALFSTKSFVLSKEYCNFAMWIERTCKPFDKGKLTTLPHFNICQQNLFNVSIMLKYKDLPQVNSERWLLLDDFEEEVWKDVVGYEGLYQVSNYGRLKSLTRRCRIPSNKFISVPCERILVSDIINGYCKIHICKNGKSKPVIQLSLNGDIIKVWTCAREAERTKGFDRSCISKCCLNKAKQYKGYMWRFLET